MSNTPSSQNSQSYPGLQAFAGDQLRTIRALYDRIHAIEGRPDGTSVTFRANPNLGGTAESTSQGLKITNAADPTDPGDLVTMRYLKKNFTGAGLAAQITPGSTALNNIVQTIIQSGAGVTVGTHADRLNGVPSPNTIFVEDDRNAIYYCPPNGSSWQLLGTTFGTQAMTADFPPDLGPADVGFTIDGVDFGLTYIWSGAIFHLHRGTYVDVFANRPTAFAGCDTGLIFCATDRGFQQWILSYGAAAWVYIGGGTPMDGTLPIGALSLTANDVGFLYHSTDFDRLYRWNGSGWADAPGQPTRGMIAYFQANPGSPWALCNGGTTTGSTAAGGTTSVTTPNLTGSTLFVRSNATAGGTGGNTTVTSSNESADVAVTAAGADGAAAAPHTHTVNILPPYYDLIPYLRL